MITISISSFVSTSGLLFAPIGYGSFSIRTSKHGDSAVQIKAIVGTVLSQTLLSSNDMRNIRVFSNGVPLWRGVITDVSANGDIVEITALGYWAFLKTQQLTGLWSHTIASDWFEIPPSITSHSNKRYEIDNDSRLYIALRKDEVYNNINVGNWGWEVPHGGINNIDTFSFTYAVELPTGYRADVISVDHGFTGASTEWFVDGDGTLQTGSENITAISNNALAFRVYRNSATDTPFTDDTESSYAYIDALRIKSISNATVDTEDVISDVYAEAVADNPNLFNAGIFSVDGGNDFQDVLYEDASVADIIASIEDAGDSSSNRLLFNLDRYNNASLQIEEGSGTVWFANVSSLSATRSLDGYTNNTYAKYQNTSGRTRRTSASSATYDIVPGVVIADFLEFRTTSESESEAVRDAYLDAAPLRAIKTGIVISSIRPENSDIIGMEFVRGGDRLIINNLPYNFQKPDRSLYYFDILDATYDAVNDTLKLSLVSGGIDQRDAIVEALTGDFDFVQI